MEYSDRIASLLSNSTMLKFDRLHESVLPAHETMERREYGVESLSLPFEVSQAKPTSSMGKYWNPKWKMTRSTTQLHTLTIELEINQAHLLEINFEAVDRR